MNEWKQCFYALVLRTHDVPFKVFQHDVELASVARLNELEKKINDLAQGLNQERLEMAVKAWAAKDAMIDRTLEPAQAATVSRLREEYSEGNLDLTQWET